MKEKRPCHSKIKSLKTLKTLSMLECDKDKSESFCLRTGCPILGTGLPIFSFTVKNYYHYTECNSHFFNKIYIDIFISQKVRIWQPKTLAIEESKDLRLLLIEELIGSLLTYEMKIKRLNEMEDEERKRKKKHALKANEDDQTYSSTMKMR
ncbi:hypothetical protein M9H77_14262 [Catharanthus roseus]|uniref:Uncharacterized protein n=1 Tax=Catharanthus roseus TaxID=4058 RepID=A0ACC0BMP5_CATRO|nr:hypothetical protein M9H77_14262 [Catharanthus roseus]